MVRFDSSNLFLFLFLRIVYTNRHHNAYFVFGHPGHNTSEPNYQERLDRHFNYKKQYESLVWMAEGLDITWQFQNWGR